LIAPPCFGYPLVLDEMRGYFLWLALLVREGYIGVFFISSKKYGVDCWEDWVICSEWNLEYVREF
jgi:hypothetical protein